MKIRCKNCSTRLSSRPAFLGKKVKCPKCGAGVRIPAKEPASAVQQIEQTKVGIRCLMCEAKIRVRPEQLGQVGHCPKCELQIPLLNDSERQIEIARRVEEARRQEKALLADEATHSESSKRIVVAKPKLKTVTPQVALARSPIRTRFESGRRDPLQPETTKTDRDLTDLSRKESRDRPPYKEEANAASLQSRSSRLKSVLICTSIFSTILIGGSIYWFQYGPGMGTETKIDQHGKAFQSAKTVTSEPSSNAAFDNNATKTANDEIVGKERLNEGSNFEIATTDPISIPQLNLEYRFDQPELEYDCRLAVENPERPKRELKFKIFHRPQFQKAKQQFTYRLIPLVDSVTGIGLPGNKILICGVDPESEYDSFQVVVNGQKYPARIAGRMTEFLVLEYNGPDFEAPLIADNPGGSVGAVVRRTAEGEMNLAVTRVPNAWSSAVFVKHNGAISGIGSATLDIHGERTGRRAMQNKLLPGLDELWNAANLNKSKPQLYDYSEVQETVPFNDLEEMLNKNIVLVNVIREGPDPAEAIVNSVLIPGSGHFSKELEWLSWNPDRSDTVHLDSTGKFDRDYSTRMAYFLGSHAPFPYVPLQSNRRWWTNEYRVTITDDDRLLVVGKKGVATAVFSERFEITQYDETTGVARIVRKMHLEPLAPMPGFSRPLRPVPRFKGGQTIDFDTRIGAIIHSTTNGKVTFDEADHQDTMNIHLSCDLIIDAEN